MLVLGPPQVKCDLFVSILHFLFHCFIALVILCNDIFTCTFIDLMTTPSIIQFFMWNKEKVHISSLLCS